VKDVFDIPITPAEAMSRFEALLLKVMKEDPR